MPTLSFDDAWTHYLSIAAALPQPAPAVAPQLVSGVLEVADRFDAVVLDAWGVLNRGDTPIMAALTAFNGLRSLGKKLFLLSNDGAKDQAGQVAKHGRRGFHFLEAEILTGLGMLPETMAILPPPERCGSGTRWRPGRPASPNP